MRLEQTLAAQLDCSALGRSMPAPAHCPGSDEAVGASRRAVKVGAWALDERVLEAEAVRFAVAALVLPREVAELAAGRPAAQKPTGSGALRLAVPARVAAGPGMGRAQLVAASTIPELVAAEKVAPGRAATVGVPTQPEMLAATAQARLPRARDPSSRLRGLVVAIWGPDHGAAAARPSPHGQRPRTRGKRPSAGRSGPLRRGARLPPRSPA
jgi:hypothetical protein